MLLYDVKLAARALERVGMHQWCETSEGRTILRLRPGALLPYDCMRLLMYAIVCWT